jgi:glycerol-3-phosphate dehydrogenase (NAD(P)+)
MARIAILGAGGSGTALATVAAKVKVETPIIHSVYSILYEKLPPTEAVNRLLSRDLRPEAD